MQRRVPHHATARARAGAGGEPEDEADAEAEDETHAQERPSRSARKRAALAAQQLGVRLTRLTPAQLHSLSLPEELLSALLEAQRLRSRAALARQWQYIGRLMRQIDTEPVQRALDATLHR
jgi:ribosome-associated protein